MILWHGGDPLLHPKWFEFSQYAGEMGISVSTLSSGIIPKKEAKKLSQLHQENRMETVGLHLDTINQEAYGQINFQPKTLDLKIQGYYNLIEAGFPPQGIFPILTLTKPVCETIEETIDWFVNEMGAKDICFCTFEPAGFGDINSHLEPSISDLQRACEHRAKRLGEHYLRIGTTDLGSLLCRTYFGITFDGDVIPCVQLPELSMGNIYEKSLKEIFDDRRDEILFNFDVHGPCAQCKNSDVCYGCRASAYHYLGDIRASDPKCWLNPEAK
jgi:radical SAM protein with 4Fe4S-binding SPASM domain